MTATNTLEEVVHTEVYEGRPIKVALRPREEGQYSARGAAYHVYVNGYSYQGGTFPVETMRRERDLDGNRVWDPTGYSHLTLVKRAIKKGRKWVDDEIRDERLRPSLENCIAYIPRSDKRARIGSTGTEPTDFEVGDRVWFYSRGNIRQGRVEKVGRTNVGVAYVTEVGGIITRKSLKPGDVGATIEDAQQVAEVR